MCNTNDLNIILDKMLWVYKTVYRENLVDVYLYGSYARGDYEEDSDIDLVAIVRGNRPEVQAPLEDIWDVAGEFGLEHDIVVSPKVIPYDEFMEYKNELPYYRNIEIEGVKISA
ncbi:MAG TPA: nucleotidyltransferase domain-containing protein [Clostridiales bacterium]|nr:nucleotidyltransferase domain-containing protein [Clostridiales bacterium]